MFISICRQKVVDFLDLSLMKDLIYVNILLGISFTIFADNTFFPLLPIYLDTLGFSKASFNEKFVIFLSLQSNMKNAIFHID